MLSNWRNYRDSNKTYYYLHFVGAETPLYLALLAKGDKNLHGKIFKDKKIMEWEWNTEKSYCMPEIVVVLSKD